MKTVMVDGLGVPKKTIVCGHSPAAYGNVRKDVDPKLLEVFMVDLKIDVVDGVLKSICDFEEVGDEVIQNKGRLFIPKDVTSIDWEAIMGVNPLGIAVDKENRVFYSKNNCLFQKEGNVLIMACQSSVIPSDKEIDTIGSCAFNIPNDLTAMDLNPLVLPSNIKHIGYRAFAMLSENPIHLVIPKGVETIGCMAFMAQTTATQNVEFTFEGSPILESGVFGTEEEALDSNNDQYKALPKIIYNNKDCLLVHCHAGSSVEEYCRKYQIPYTIF